MTKYVQKQHRTTTKRSCNLSMQIFRDWSFNMDRGRGRVESGEGGKKRGLRITFRVCGGLRKNLRNKSYLELGRRVYKNFMNRSGGGEYTKNFDLREGVL